MDREKVLNEYVRILKPGGSMALLENLPYNPFINLYRIHRKLTARTQQSREYLGSIKGYIKSNDIDRLRQEFRFMERREYHLIRMNSIYLLEKIPYNTIAQKLDAIFSNIDTMLLASIPFLRKLAWYVAVYYEDNRRETMRPNTRD